MKEKGMGKGVLCCVGEKGERKKEGCICWKINVCVRVSVWVICLCVMMAKKEGRRRHAFLYLYGIYREGKGR